MSQHTMHRRDFLRNSSALLAMSTLYKNGIDLNNASSKRVALIGAGWYGKSDLFRLIQVAPVEVVALCDVDEQMLNAAGTLVSQRQKSRKVPKLYGNYRKMLSENELDMV